MEVTNCRSCGRLFNYLSGPSICPECKGNLEKKFQEVKDYVRSNPMCTINQVAEDNNVTPGQVKQWIREERLQFADDSPVGIECEKCGATIKTGRFCESCKDNMANLFEQQIRPKDFGVDNASNTHSSGDRMFFQHNGRK